MKRKAVNEGCRVREAELSDFEGIDETNINNIIILYTPHYLAIWNTEQTFKIKHRQYNKHFL